MSRPSSSTTLFAPDARSFISAPFRRLCSRAARSGPGVRPFPASRSEPDGQPAPLSGGASRICLPLSTGSLTVQAPSFHATFGLSPPGRAMPVPPQRRDPATGARSCIGVKSRATGRAQARSVRRANPRPAVPRRTMAGTGARGMTRTRGRLGFSRRFGPGPAPASSRGPCGARDAIGRRPRLHASRCRRACAVSGQSTSRSSANLPDTRIVESGT